MVNPSHTILLYSDDLIKTLTIDCNTCDYTRANTYRSKPMIRRDDYKVDHEYRFTRVKRRTWYDRWQDFMEYAPYFAVSIGLIMAAMYAGGVFGGNFEQDMNAILNGTYWDGMTDNETDAKWVYVDSIRALFNPEQW